MTQIQKLVCFLQQTLTRGQEINSRTLSCPKEMNHSTAVVYFGQLAKAGFFTKIRRGIYVPAEAFFESTPEEVCRMLNDHLRQAREARRSINSAEDEPAHKEASEPDEVEFEVDALDVVRSLGVTTVLQLVQVVLEEREEGLRKKASEDLTARETLIAQQERQLRESETIITRLRSELTEARKNLLEVRTEANKRVTVRSSDKRKLFAKPIVPGGLQSGGSGARGAGVVVHGRAPKFKSLGPSQLKARIIKN